MAIDFPNSPSINDTYTVDSRTWVWTGTAWRIVTASVGPTGPTGPAGYEGSDGPTGPAGEDGKFFTGSTPPSTPSEGDAWYNSDSGRLYVYYDSYWVEASAPIAGPTGPAGADGTIGVDGATGPTGPSGDLTRTIRTVSSSTTLLSTDENQMIRFTGTSAQTLTIPDVLTPGSSVEILQDNSGSVDLESSSGVTLLSSNGGFSTLRQNSVVTLRCVASGQYRLAGDLKPPLTITGGTLSSDSTYYYRTFTSSGSLTIDGSDLSVDILAVAGGGSGGAISIGQTVRAAGGGAGGLVYLSSYTLPEASYTIAVGSGGSSSSGSAVAKGSDTVISGGGRVITTFGGGSGGYNDSTNNATSGGSGGGQWYPGYTGAAATQPSTTNDGVANYVGTGFGNKGGDSGNVQPYASGGGGAGAPGKNYNSVGGPVGGIGKQYSEFSTATGTGANGGYYAGGGGGAGYPPETSTYAEYAGGLGGGGTGSNDSFAITSNAVVNTGGGGGSGGSGGSGIVIVRYLKSAIDLV